MNSNSDQRLAALQNWLKNQLTQANFTLTLLAGDASFRRYFRVHLPEKTLIAMDAPPEKEDSHPFIEIAKIFHKKNLKVPEIIAVDLTQGFLLLTDLGDDLYFRVLNKHNAEQLYGNAIRELLTIQKCQQNQGWHFPAFDDMMKEELLRFREWYLLKHLNLALSDKEENILTAAFETLVNSALAQPQVCVHRDYHSRNLLALTNNSVGILDFQDAVWGPITYDLVSLIRDCYIAWPDTQVITWAKNYFQQASQVGIMPQQQNFLLFMRWFDWMGMQRHLKAIYIFARKFRRDNNPNYLPEIPRTLHYILTVGGQYPEFKNLIKFLQTRVLPYESSDLGSRTRTTHASTDR